LFVSAPIKHTVNVGAHQNGNVYISTQDGVLKSV